MHFVKKKGWCLEIQNSKKEIVKIKLDFFKRDSSSRVDELDVPCLVLCDDLVLRVDTEEKVNLW